MSNAATASEKKPRKKKEAVADPDSTQPGEGDATTKKTRRQPASAAPAPAKRASIPVTRFVSFRYYSYCTFMDSKMM
jgi:hypothetical protein